VEWVEASGRSLGEAKETALDLLGVAEDDAEFVVLSEPKAGLFGRVRGEARVQARVRPVTPPPKRGRRQRPERKRSGENGARERTPKESGASVEAGAEGNGSAAPAKRKRSSSKGPAKGSVERTEGGKANGEQAAASTSGSGEGRNGGRNGSGSSGSRQQAKQRTGGSPEEREGIVEESLTIEEQGQAGKEFVTGLIREFGFEADVQFRELDEETVEITAAGDDLGLLVGPRGATLSAVQDLTRTFVQRQSENRTDRILVDVGGYREKRTAALRRFTEGIVAEVKESGTERALEPMTAADRKVVHDAVNEQDGVQTRSEGEDPSRYIVIEPVD
jgi:spoIIIJ-associated protein